jgi:hypothetical protein
MSRFVQAFFWEPDEIATWMKKAISSSQLWSVLWEEGNDASFLALNDIRPEMFIGAGQVIQIFLGLPELAPAPAWRYVNGRRLLDFPKSYAVQLIPSTVVPDQNVLLLGQIAILRQDQYDDPKKASDLITLFRRLRSDMSKNSDRSHAVVQVLSNGTMKYWSDILLGKELSDRSHLRLKQFVKGEVLFEIAPSDSNPKARTRH